MERLSILTTAISDTFSNGTLESAKAEIETATMQCNGATCDVYTTLIIGATIAAVLLIIGLYVCICTHILKKRKIEELKMQQEFEKQKIEDEKNRQSTKLKYELAWQCILKIKESHDTDKTHPLNESEAQLRETACAYLMDLLRGATNNETKIK